MKSYAFLCIAAMAAAATSAAVPAAAPPPPGAGAAMSPMSPGFGASFAGPFSMYMMPPAGIPGVPGGVPGVVGGLPMSGLGSIPSIGVPAGVVPTMPPAVASLVKKKVALGTSAAAAATAPAS